MNDGWDKLIFDRKSSAWSDREKDSEKKITNREAATS